MNKKWGGGGKERKGGHFSVFNILQLPLGIWHFCINYLEMIFHFETFYISIVHIYLIIVHFLK